MNWHESLCCRICGGPIEDVLSLGNQCLAGQFPTPAEADPPAFPLTLAYCRGSCGLTQLRHTISGELLYRNYWYRSGISQTMKTHLRKLADESLEILGHPVGISILDIGGNDGTLLSYFSASNNRTLIDPCQNDWGPEAQARSHINRIRGFFPQNLPLHSGPYDLIFSVACFYDVDNPIVFAQKVREHLCDDGLWCCEVADLSVMVATGAYDQICHEHVTYFDWWTFASVLARAEMRVVNLSFNGCNGGSIRFWCARQTCTKYNRFTGWFDKLNPLPTGKPALLAFKDKVQKHRLALREYVLNAEKAGKVIHLLGASTKMNTVLQYCQLDVPFASDRDPRKHGRETPGTRIAIISEEDSRQLKPDIYLCPLHGFREEIIQREQEFLKAGGKIVFLFPDVEEVSG